VAIRPRRQDLGAQTLDLWPQKDPSHSVKELLSDADSHRMKHRLTALAFIAMVLGLAACSDGPTTSPSTPSGQDFLVIIRAISTQTGRAISGLQVTVLDGSHAGKSVTTQSDQAPLQLLSGPMTLRVVATGHQPIEKTLTVAGAMVVEVSVDPIPTPPPPTYRYFGTVRDGLGAPMVGVLVKSGTGDCRFSAVTDASGRYEDTSECSSPFVTVTPPAGFEGLDRYDSNPLSPGQANNFTTKRIMQISWNYPPEIVRGTQRSVQVSVRFDDGVTRTLGSRDSVTLGSSDETIVRTHGAVGSLLALEGISVGTATVTAYYWGTSMPPVTIRVVSSN